MSEPNPKNTEESPNSQQESIVAEVETEAPKPKPEVRSSTNPEASGWDALDKNDEKPAVEVVKTIETTPIRPSANPEASGGGDELDKSKTLQSPGTNPTQKTSPATPSNFLPEIAEMMKKTLIIAGGKLEAGEFNDFGILIRQLASYSEDVANTELQTYAAELADMIENANKQRRSSLLSMRTKIHALNQFIEK